MDELELNKSYSYNNLDKWFEELIATDPNAEWVEYGNDKQSVCGETFLVINTSMTYSFVLDGYIQAGPNKGAQYKLIFKA